MPCSFLSPRVASRPFSFAALAVPFLAALFALSALCPLARGQALLVTNYYTGTIGEYNATTGAAYNTSFVSGLNGPQGIAISGSNLWVALTGNGHIGQYNSNTGAAINSSLIAFSEVPLALAVSGSILYVSEFQGLIAKFNASTGASEGNLVGAPSYPEFLTVAAGTLYVSDEDMGIVHAFNATSGTSVFSISGLSTPYGLAVSGSNLYVANNVNGHAGAGYVSVYNAATGALINASFITGLNSPWGLAVSSGNLYVANYANGLGGTGSIGEYNATTGAVVNASFITGLSGPQVILITDIAVDHFAVSAPSSAIAGTPFNYTVTAEDASNNPIPTYSGTVQFVSSDASAALPANSTLTNGTGTFSATLNTAGNQTITASDTVTTSVTGTSGLIAVNDFTTHLAVRVSSTTTAGSPLSVTVTALDANNVKVTSYLGVVQITSTDGGATLPPSAFLNNGVGTFAVTLNTPGTQTITATDTVAMSITGSATVAVSTAATVTHFSVIAPASAISGAPINVIVAALNAANATVPSYAGTVQFLSSDITGTEPANATLTNGTGTFSFTLQAVGSQNLGALDTVSLLISGNSGTIAVNPANTSIVLGFSANPVGFGQPVTLTATVTAAAPSSATVNTGTVQFSVNGSAVGAPAAVNGTGHATYTTSALASGSLSVTAAYSPSIGGNFNSSNSSASGLVVGAAPTATATTLGSSASSVLVGQSVTFTASVETSPGSPTVPTGTVQFSINGLPVGTPVALNNGQATFTTSFLGAGTPGITAAYIPNSATFLASTSSVSIVAIVQLSTVTLLGSSASSVLVGQSVTFTASLRTSPGSPTVPTGAVQFSISGLPVGGPVALNNGQATYSTNSLGAGTTGITAAYSPNSGTFLASSSSTSSLTTYPGSEKVGFGTINLHVGAFGAHGAPISAAAAATSLAVDLTASGTTGTMVGYIASINAGFTANFILVNGGFTTTTTTLTGGASPGQTLTLTGSLSNGVLSGSIVELNQTFSATLDPATGASSAVAGLYQASSATAGSITYSILGTQGELFLLAITPGLVSAGVGTVDANDNFTVTTTQGTTISGSVNAATTAISGTVTPQGGAAASFSGESAGDSPAVSPASPSAVSGSTLILTSSTAAASPTYQWEFNGVPIAGATASTLTLANLGTTQSGSYAVVVTSGTGSALSNAATVSVASNAWLSNLSCRAFISPAVNAADVLIAGFVTAGPSTKQLLVRGSGPALQQFDVPGFLVNPSLTIYSGPTAGTTLTSWSPSLSSLFANLEAFPFPAGSNDTATLNPFNPGAYTAILSAADGKQSGVALIELYDADQEAPTNRLVNISGRALAGTGANILIGGFVVSGSTSETLLIRAIGPGLGAAPFNLPGTLAKPLMQVFDSNRVGNQIIAQIQGWGGAPVQGPSPISAGIQPATAAVMSSVGAFSLASGSADSAMVLTLPPGAYTVSVSGADGGSGVALVEIYEVAY